MKSGKLGIQIIESRCKTVNSSLMTGSFLDLAYYIYKNIFNRNIIRSVIHILNKLKYLIFSKCRKFISRFLILITTLSPLFGYLDKPS